MRYRKDYGTVQTLRFHYLTKNMIVPIGRESYISFHTLLIHLTVSNCFFFVNQTGEEVRPNFDWFKKQVKERRWLRSSYDRYRCSICYLGKEAAKLKLKHNKSDDDMMTVTDKNGLVNEKKNK